VPAYDGTELAVSCYRNMGRFYIRYARRPLGQRWMALVQDERIVELADVSCPASISRSVLCWALWRCVERLAPERLTVVSKGVTSRWCTTGVPERETETQPLVRLSVLPANRDKKKVDPTRLELVTSAMRRRSEDFAVVRRRSKMRLNRPNLRSGLPQMFADVRLGCRQTVVNQRELLRVLLVSARVVRARRTPGVRCWGRWRKQRPAGEMGDTCYLLRSG
jgi:hypothetical protein